MVNVRRPPLNENWQHDHSFTSLGRTQMIVWFAMIMRRAGCAIRRTFPV